MKFSNTFWILSIILSLFFISKIEAAKKCLFDSQCPGTATCDQTFPNPIGYCKEGLPPKSACLRDKQCASKNCHLFKCI